MKHICLVAVLLFSADAGRSPPGARRSLRGRNRAASCSVGTCVYCHGPNVWGTFTLGRRLGADHALLEQRTDLVGPYVKTVIRAGVGSMPAFRRTELTDADVDAIVDYLTRANRAK